MKIMNYVDLEQFPVVYLPTDLRHSLNLKHFIKNKTIKSVQKCRNLTQTTPQCHIPICVTSSCRYPTCLRRRLKTNLGLGIKLQVRRVKVTYSSEFTTKSR